MTDHPAQPDQPKEGAGRMGEPEGKQNRPEPHGNADAGPGKEDPTRTPGDGTLQGATPAGLTTKELLERAEAPGETNDTGTG